jgi:hypothetical protein
MVSNAFAVYIGGDFGLTSYQDSSGLRTLFSATPSASVYGSVTSLAVADHASSCVYVAGALTEASSGKIARFVRRCQASGAHPAEIATIEKDGSWNALIVLKAVN